MLGFVLNHLISHESMPVSNRLCNESSYNHVQELVFDVHEKAWTNYFAAQDHFHNDDSLSFVLGLGTLVLLPFQTQISNTM